MNSTTWFKVSLALILYIIMVGGMVAKAQEVLDWQPPRVPQTINLGNMQLHLTEQARRDVQADVDALYRSPKFFQLKVEKVDMYLPVIEPILTEYHVPNEFKYLVIQESGLVPDAVSSSNAVGYWQFKEGTATELGMRVDRQVDERMNIVSSTEGAMKYLLRSNTEFNNWVYSLLSYNVGQGGASRMLDKKYYGARQLKIDHNTHWYVKKFLSHLIAFEAAIGRLPRQIMLYQYQNTSGKSLKVISQEFGMAEDTIEPYNKWLQANRVPDDKVYTVVVPLSLDESEELVVDNKVKDSAVKKKALEELQFGRLQQGPGKMAAELSGPRVFKELNGLRATLARPGDKITSLADAGDVSVYNFIKWNDISPNTKIQVGQVYYFKKKKNKATVYKHTALEGESMWQISQQYGIREKKLRQKNRMDKSAEPEAGQILWMRYIRPNDQEVEFDEAIRQAATKEAAGKQVEATPVPMGNLEASRSRMPLVAKSIANQDNQKVAAQATLQSLKLEIPPIQVLPTDTPQTVVTKKIAEPIPAEDEMIPEVEADPQQLYPERQAAARNIIDENAEKSEIDTLVYYAGEEAAFEPEEAVIFIDEELDSSSSTNNSQPIINSPGGQNPTTPAAQEGASMHTVVSGETLYSISRKYNITVEELRKINAIAPSEALRIGQQLSTIGSAEPDTAKVNAKLVENKDADKSTSDKRTVTTVSTAIYHIVAEGETMYRVARLYNVTIKDIMEWNKLEGFNIKPGERLLVKPAK